MFIIISTSLTDNLPSSPNNQQHVHIHGIYTLRMNFMNILSNWAMIIVQYTLKSSENEFLHSCIKFDVRKNVAKYIPKYSGLSVNIIHFPCIVLSLSLSLSLILSLSHTHKMFPLILTVIPTLNSHNSLFFDKSNTFNNYLFS